MGSQAKMYTRVAASTRARFSWLYLAGLAFIAFDGKEGSFQGCIQPVSWYHDFGPV